MPWGPRGRRNTGSLGVGFMEETRVLDCSLQPDALHCLPEPLCPHCRDLDAPPDSARLSSLCIFCPFFYSWAPSWLGRLGI